MCYELAKSAYLADEIPIGCVIIKDGEVIAKAHNMKEQLVDITAHAEINCLRSAATKLNTYNLSGCILYVSVEPCIMCYSAIIQSRIKTIYVGCRQLDFKKQTYRILELNAIQCHDLDDKRCSLIMTKFFKEKRC